MNALRDNADTITAVRDAHSVADSLTVQAPRNAILCLRAIRSSGGGGVTVGDQDIIAAISQLARIIAAISQLARLSGVFAEPAGAAALAGLGAALSQGLVERGEQVVLLVTGTGLKDIPSATAGVQVPSPIPPSIESVVEHLAISR